MSEVIYRPSDRNIIKRLDDQMHQNAAFPEAENIYGI
jgi:hypothetical protein